MEIGNCATSNQQNNWQIKSIKCLDDLGIPAINSRERAAMLSKMLHIPKQQAWGLLEGHMLPDHDLLKRIGDEFGVDPEQLVK